MAALAVMAGIAALASGCGGGSPSSTDAASSPGTANAAKGVAFANCMRAHGADVSVGSNGQLSSNGGGSGGGGSSQAFQTAQADCRHLLPNGGQPPQAQQQNNLKLALKYTQCMRSHGVPNFPDPTSKNGLYGFRITPGSGINPKSATYQKANQACQSITGSGQPGPGQS